MGRLSKPLDDTELMAYWGSKSSFNSPSSGIVSGRGPLILLLLGMLLNFLIAYNYSLNRPSLFGADFPNFYLGSLNSFELLSCDSFICRPSMEEVWLRLHCCGMLLLEITFRLSDEWLCSFRNCSMQLSMCLGILAQACEFLVMS